MAPTPAFAGTRKPVQDEKPFSWQWYYTMELAPGAVTKGEAFTNVALTRELLRRTAVRGHECLDICTMECLVTSLLCRRGAASVVGYDRPAWIKPRSTWCAPLSA